MKPVGQNILVKPFLRDNVTDLGIIVPDSVKKESNKVSIIEVGNGSPKKPMKFSKGQIGFRVKDWGDEIIIEGEKHYLMHQDSIIALQ